MKKEGECSFIIWTLQRTGGTNLAEQLSKIIKLPEVLHEPFNRKRIYGSVTKNWIRTKNQESLLDEMLTICSLRKCIKHCVEVVPWKISQALGSAACTSNDKYLHIFLYRKNSSSRLLSLEYAKRNQIWGPGSAKKVDDSDSFKDPLPVQKLIDHEKYCNSLLLRSWKHIVSEGGQPIAVAYEDIYQSDKRSAIEKLKQIFRLLGILDLEKNENKFIAEILTSGDQGTRKKYNGFLGAEDLKSQLNSLKLFQFDKLDK